MRVAPRADLHRKLSIYYPTPPNGQALAPAAESAEWDAERSEWVAERGFGAAESSRATRDRVLPAEDAFKRAADRTGLPTLNRRCIPFDGTQHLLDLFQHGVFALRIGRAHHQIEVAVRHDPYHGRHSVPAPIGGAR